MTIPVLSITRDALGGDDLGHCESRSLFLNRFADPQARDSKESSPRKRWFEMLVKKSANRGGIKVDGKWLPERARILYGQLRGRLMINMADGAMENAHLNLDRFGFPVIPGSAVKGCARRMALKALRDWVETGEERPVPGDIGVSCCRGFETPGAMLAAIARVFGWTGRDWEEGIKDNLFRSDFGWACGENHARIWKEAAVHISATFGWPLDVTATPWKKLPDSSGKIAFLPAAPCRDPGLELDVLTPHHKSYYSQNPDDAENSDREKTPCQALDNENPTPVFFPAVKVQNPRDFFIFPLLPLGSATDEDLLHARHWLSSGLEIFGIGAKTNAGYGWFDASDKQNNDILAYLEKQDAARKRDEAEKERKGRRGKGPSREENSTIRNGGTPPRRAGGFENRAPFKRSIRIENYILS